MPLKKAVYLLLILFSPLLMGQNMQLLYDFDRLPQGLLLNPGSEVDYRMHIGVPLLSNAYAQFGASNRDITYNKILRDADGFDEVLSNIYGQDLSDGDIFVVNQQIEVFSGGFRLADPRYYLSFGMYQHFSGFTSYPSDLADIYFTGNDRDRNGVPETNEIYSIRNMNTIGELVGVFHAGINMKVNERLSLGGRLKILSGSIGFDTRENSGNYYMNLSPFPGTPYLHHYENTNVRINSSGLLDPVDLSSDVGDRDEIISSLFFMGGNLGLSLDVGFTYDLAEQWTLTGSLLDLGMIHFTKKLATIELQDDVIGTVDYFNPPAGGEFDYWRDLYFGQLIPMVTSANEYDQLRAPKLNASLRYNTTRTGRGKEKTSSAFRNVSCDFQDVYYDMESSAGIQLYTEYRPQTVLWAVTGFYSREFIRGLKAKFTYTADLFSYYNIGLGISARINSFNLFVAADNLLALPTFGDSNYQPFQLGMNVIFK